ASRSLYNERLAPSHFTAIKNITEVALRAMSPGINDPATALLAINYLLLLLAKRMELADQIHHSDEDKEVRVVQRLMPFSTLLALHYAELRTYAAHDPAVASRLLEGLDYLLQQPTSDAANYEAIQRERNLLIEHATQLIKIEADYPHYRRQPA
ncbi:MAG: DUF2254 family protein, partial [Bacteroidota bacterium]